MTKLNNQNPIIWVVLLSFMLSVAMSFRDVINADGILYLRTAREFAQHHYAQAFALYSWPFYSAFIAALSSITPLSLEQSAILINASLMALTGAGFVTLVRELGGNKTVQWTALLVFMAHPGFNGYREYIIRDFGAWGFLLWSIVFLCRCSNQPTWKNVIGWTLASGMALLFRPENIIWLGVGPLVLLFMKQSVMTVLRCYSIFAVLGLFLFALILLFDLTLPYSRIHDLFANVNQLFVSGIDRYMTKAQAFREILSPQLKEHHAMIILGFALLMYLSFSLIKTFSLLYLVLLGYAVYHRPLVTAPQKKILIGFLMIYGLIYICFIGMHYFISSRYLIPFIVVLMIWVPFALTHLWERAPKALKYTLGLIMVYMFLSGVLSFGYSKQYLKEAGRWINHNTSTNAVLYTENKQVAYYADRTLTSNPNEADVIAVYYSRKNPEAHLLIDSLSHDKQIDFHNKRQDGVRVILSPSSKVTAGSYPNTD